MGHKVQLPQNEAVRITVLPRAADLILVVRVTPLPSREDEPRERHPVLTFVIPDPSSRTPGRTRESILLTTISKKCKEECGPILDPDKPFPVGVEISRFDPSDGKFKALPIISRPTTDKPLLPTCVTTKGGEALVTFEEHAGNGDKIEVDSEAIRRAIEAWTESSTAVNA